MKKYESPKVEFESIRLNEKIANTCWGHHGKGTQLFYDVKGAGYIGFYITGGSCEFGEGKISVNYYNIPEKNKDNAYKEFYKAVINSGGDTGNNYNGEGTVIKPNPDPNWS